MIAASTRDNMDLLKDAEEHVESVMSTHVAAIVRTPVATIGGKKRQLSMSDESVMKKVKGDTKGERDLHKARRTLYKRPDDSYDDEDGGGGDQDSPSLLNDNVRKTYPVKSTTK